MDLFLGSLFCSIFLCVCSGPIKIPMTYFTDLEKNISKIYMEPKPTLNSLSNLEKEEHRRRDHNLISNHVTNPLESKQSATGIRTDTEINGIE